MSAGEGQSFSTGPAMVRPAPAMILLVACVALAASQGWIAAVRWTEGAARGEPFGRAFFAAICTAAAFGVAVALLERRNGRVLLDDSRITIRSWRGRERTVEWDEVEAIDLTVPEGDEPELPFHWLTARTPDGGRIRLAGGPWPESVELRRLRREIVTRLGSSGGSAREFRPGRLLSATRQCWS